jgi:hypothetical protein
MRRAIILNYRAFWRRPPDGAIASSPRSAATPNNDMEVFFCGGRVSLGDRSVDEVTATQGGVAFSRHGIWGPLLLAGRMVGEVARE